MVGDAASPNITGTAAATVRIGDPCDHCGGLHRTTVEFNGYWLTICDHCGEEL